MLVVAATMISCDQTRIYEVGEVPDGQCDVTINTSAVTRGTKLPGLVYHLASYFEGELHERYDADTSGVFEVRLMTGVDFTFVAWADYDKGYYNTGDLEKITVDYDNYAINDEERDGFFGSVVTSFDSSTSSVSMELERPFARINVTSLDMGDVKMTDLEPVLAELSYSSELYTSINAMSGEAGDLKVCEGVISTAISDENYDEESGTLLISYDYLLAPASDRAIANFFMAFTLKNGVTGYCDYTFSNIPYERNYITNIYGNIFTDQGTIDFDVNDDWTGDIDTPLDDPEEPAEDVSFNDDAFMNAVLGDYDEDGDGVISAEEALLVKEITCGGYGDDVTDLTGVERFVNLESITIGSYAGDKCPADYLTSNAELTTLSMSRSTNASQSYYFINFNQNTKLKNLSLSDFKDNIFIGELYELETLYISSGDAEAFIGEFDITKFTKLTSLELNGYVSSISSVGAQSDFDFDLSYCTELTRVELNGNINTLNLKNCTKLTYLAAAGSEFTTLDLTDAVLLEELRVNICDELTALDLSNNTKLSIIYARGAGLQSVVLPYSTTLTSIDVAQCYLDALDIRKLSALTAVYCGIQKEVGTNSTKYMTLTLTQSQYDGGVFNSTDGANAYVTVNIQD